MFPSGKVIWVYCSKQSLVANAQALDWDGLGFNNGSATYQLYEFNQASVTQFPYLQNWENNSAYLLGFLWKLNELMHWEKWY